MEMTSAKRRRVQSPFIEHKSILDARLARPGGLEDVATMQQYIDMLVQQIELLTTQGVVDSHQLPRSCSGSARMLGSEDDDEDGYREIEPEPEPKPEPKPEPAIIKAAEATTTTTTTSSSTTTSTHSIETGQELDRDSSNHEASSSNEASDSSSSDDGDDKDASDDDDDDSSSSEEDDDDEAALQAHERHMFRLAKQQVPSLASHDTKLPCIWVCRAVDQSICEFTV